MFGPTRHTRVNLIAACSGALACSPGTPAAPPAEPTGSAESASTSDPSDSTAPTTTCSSTTTGPETTEDPSSTGSSSSTGAAPDLPEVPPDPNDAIPPPDGEGCPAIYAQDLLPTFEITVAPEVWEQLMFEWNHGQDNEDAGIDVNPYHPLIEFKYGDVRIDDAAIRLRGNPTFWTPLPGDKMQFQIGFHTVDPTGDFWGLRRLALDAATYNRHMLRDRLSLAFMRHVGIRAPCANSARLVVNGEYYGLFTNIEKMDEIFLKRNMLDPGGALWDRHDWELKTALGPESEARLELLKDAETLPELEALLDVEQALLTYAAEAVIPDSDGAWGGGLNYFVYDDPQQGKFLLLPWDLDNTFERFNDDSDGPYPVNPDPLTWEKPTTHGRPWYDLIVKDPARFELYVDTIDQILHQGYEPAKMLAWVDEMSAQIEDAVLTDTHKPYSNDVYFEGLQKLRDFIPGRYDFVDAWLVCWQTGGVDDGSGTCVMP